MFTILFMKWYLMNSLVLRNIMWYPLFVVPVVAVQGKTTKTHPEPTMLDRTPVKFYLAVVLIEVSAEKLRKV